MLELLECALVGVNPGRPRGGQKRLWVIPGKAEEGVTTVLGKGNASPEHTRHRTSVLGRLTCFSASGERLSGWFPRLSQLLGSV